MTHRAYPVVLDYSIMILYSTSNVSFGSSFCIHSRSFNSPEYPTESQRPYHGSMQTNGQSGCVLVAGTTTRRNTSFSFKDESRNQNKPSSGISLGVSMDEIDACLLYTSYSDIYFSVGS